jgi:hypothetical protein
MDRLTPEGALARAVEATDLDDFGDDGFRDGLERTLAAFTSLPLQPAARNQAEGGVVRGLANRLRIEAWCKSHPEVADQVIESPVSVVGLPRTGTTATVAMLALDDRFRFPRGWEGREPVPPPIAGEEDQDPRVRAARAAAHSQISAALHLSDPDGPEEDLTLLAGLNCRGFHGQFPMPDDYMAWWMADDFVSTYAYHHKTLQLLQSRRPPNKWLLKSPPNLFNMEAFAAQHPHVKFVMTHRDPAKAISSVASFYQALYQGSCEPESLDRSWTGARALSCWAEGMRRGLEARQKLGEHRFIDVHNRDLIRDPIAVLERVYDHLGMTVSDDLVAKWRQYQQDNAKGKFGGHDHRPEDFGLDAHTIRSTFKDYVERFDL